MGVIEWLPIGQYEHQFVWRPGKCFATGWYRCIEGRLRDGRHPEWNDATGEKRYS